MTDSTSVSGSITRLLHQLHTQDEQVVQDVFNYYFQRLAGLARQHLRNLGGVRFSDEEDLAMLVLKAFLQDASSAEIGELRSRHDVWRMLAKRTRFRAINLVRDDGRLRGNEVGESVFRDGEGKYDPLGIQHQPGGSSDDPVDHLYQELLSRLSDPFQQRVASLLLDGQDVPQIAEQTGKAITTIYRKIGKIKKCWLASKAG